VEQARTGTNGTGDNNATQILANFDLTIYDTFKQNLDRFGAALTAAAKNPGNLKQLQAEIDMTTIPDTAMPEAQSHDRDLKAFAQNVLADSRSHKLSGDTKTLETAAKSLIKSFDPLVTNQFGDKKKEYDQLGGLTASIPGSEILNGKRVAQEVTPLHEMSNQLKEVLDTNPPLSYKSRVTHYINHRINELPQQLVQQYQKQVKEMTEAQSGIERAQDLTAYRAALTRMQQVTSKIDSGPMGAQMAKGMKREAANEELGYLNSRIEQVAPEWDNFVGLMQEQMTPAD
jgi:hypothetical protein